ncbi:MAG: hypothetical protein WCC06_05005 [Candidatus Aminicenantales bacterium]
MKDQLSFRFVDVLVRKKFLFFLYILEVLAIGSFLWHRLLYPYLAEGKHGFFWPASVFLLWSFFLGAVLSIILRFVIRFLAGRTGAAPSELARLAVFSLLPVLFLFLDFLQYVFFLMDIRSYLVPVEKRRRP